MAWLSNTRDMVALGIAGAALLACVGLCGALWWQGRGIATLEAENASLRLSVDACNARIKNIARDKESDNEVDHIPDDDLRNVPDGWLRGPGSGGVY